MAPPPSHLQKLLPADLRLKRWHFDQQNGSIAVIAEPASGTACCPTCRRCSSRVHSRHSRRVLDLPWHGAFVELRIELRRFRCPFRDCPRKTYVERLPRVMGSHARQTARLSEIIRIIGYALGGEAGSRLANRLRLKTSPDTVLRRLKSDPNASRADPLAAVGVDDWAWRKGQRYGTILVDLERHVPVDLLAERAAETLETWLKAHPGVQVISRDRAGVYAEGATMGAPDAIQVADRFHLLCNLTSAVERSLESRRGQLRRAFQTEIGATNPALAESPVPANQARKTRSDRQKEERRQRRLERYNQVLELHCQGMSQNDISRKLGLERKTVRRFLRAGQFPERAQPRRRPARVSAFQVYLKERWKEGCHRLQRTVQSL